MIANDQKFELKVSPVTQKVAYSELYNTYANYSWVEHPVSRKDLHFMGLSDIPLVYDYTNGNCIGEESMFVWEQISSLILDDGEDLITGTIYDFPMSLDNLYIRNIISNNFHKTFLLAYLNESYSNTIFAIDNKTDDCSSGCGIFVSNNQVYLQNTNLLIPSDMYEYFTVLRLITFNNNKFNFNSIFQFLNMYNAVNSEEKDEICNILMKKCDGYIDFGKYISPFQCSYGCQLL